MRRSLPAFTLIELLVVIAIVAVLITLLIPAINSAIESGRQTTCMARQARLALAMVAYDSRQNCLPGVRNKLDIASPGSTSTRLLSRQVSVWPTKPPAMAAGSLPIGASTPGWFIMLLPTLERTDLFDAVVSGNIWYSAAGGAGDSAFSNLALDLTTCPSRGDWASSGRAYANMHYRANGAGIGSSPFNRDDGAIGDNANGIAVSLADITAGDGLANTLLITEGGAAAAAISVGETWYPTTIISWSGPTTDPCWFPHYNGNNGSYKAVPDAGGNLLFGLPSITLNDKTKVINNGHDRLPWSAHTGGCGVAFADGSCRFLREDLKAYTYGHLVTSRSVWNAATSSYSNNSNSATATSTTKLPGKGTANDWLQCPPAPKPYALKPADY